MDKSLVQAEPAGGVTRYRMLETVRQYAAERLAERGECEGIAAAHRDWAIALAEEAEPHLTGPDQQTWLQRLEVEHGNLTAALMACAMANDPVPGLRLAAALLRFWRLRGHISEGREHLRRALARQTPPDALPLRAKALSAAGNLALLQGDAREAEALFAASLGIRRDLGDPGGVARTLNNLGNAAKERADYVAAGALFEESLQYFRETDDLRGVAVTLGNLGIVAHSQGDTVAARARFEESLRHFRALGDSSSVASVLHNLGLVARTREEYAAAQTLFAESLSLRRSLVDPQGVAASLGYLGLVALQQGDAAAAQALLEESLTLRTELGDRGGSAWTLNNLGLAASALGEPATALALCAEGLSIRRDLGERAGVYEGLEGAAEVLLRGGEAQCAVSLWTIAHALRASVGIPLAPCERACREASLQIAHMILGSAQFCAAQETRMTWRQAVDHVIAMARAAAP